MSCEKLIYISYDSDSDSDLRDSKHIVTARQVQYYVLGILLEFWKFDIIMFLYAGARAAHHR